MRVTTILLSDFCQQKHKPNRKNKTMKATTTIAILASTAALASAMEASLVKRYPDATFTPIKKLNERPAGSIVASLGLPSFVPGTEGVKVLSFGSRILDNATPAERSHQWTVLRDPSASVEDVVAELGNYEEYQVTKAKQIAEAKEAVVDVKVALIDAETDAERLALYKQGFESLAKMLS
jgi:hypothetical protein